MFDTALSGESNIDTIVEMSSADVIHLARAIFSVLPLGALSAAAFALSASGAVDADDRIIYDQDTGVLSYDPDGSGSQNAVAFAILQGSPNISNLDFVIV